MIQGRSAYIGQYGHVVEGSHPTKYDGVVVQLLSRDYAAVGDKLSNRHGNKCTVSKVSSTDMPFIRNGRQADILLNPLGLIIPASVNDQAKQERPKPR